jgi:DNA-binding MarR family transcriptional regulator
VLLAQVLLALTLDFERESRVSLPLSANTLRVLNESGRRPRDLPGLSGVSREANQMAVGFLVRHGCAVVHPDPTAARGKVVHLTEKGEKAQAKYRRLQATTERAWVERFGVGVIAGLRSGLEQVVIDRKERLRDGMQPFPEGWRAALPRPGTLPHYPMVLHRGGYPDGS